MFFPLTDHRNKYKPLPLTFPTISDPATGADFTTTVPTGKIWLPVSLYGKCVTSATSANRRPRLEILDASSNVIAQQVSDHNQAATLTFRYSWTLGAQDISSSNGTYYTLPMPWVPLSAGFVLRLQTNNIDSGDAWTQMKLAVIQFDL